MKYLVLFNDVKPGVVTIDVWSGSKVGNGYERHSAVTGRIVSIGAIVKAYGCSTTWQWVEIDPQ